MGRAAKVSWEQVFADPITVPDGWELRSPRDAGKFIASLPQSVQDCPEWQAAPHALLGLLQRFAV
jgi:hypothetical protein